MGQCGITSSKTVLVFLNLIFWVSPAVRRERRRLRGSRSEPGPESAAGLAQEPGALPPPHRPARVPFSFKLSVFNGRSEPLRGLWGWVLGAVPSLAVLPSSRLGGAERGLEGLTSIRDLGVEAVV